MRRPKSLQSTTSPLGITTSQMLNPRAWLILCLMYQTEQKEKNIMIICMYSLTHVLCNCLYCGCSNVLFLCIQCHCGLHFAAPPFLLGTFYIITCFLYSSEAMRSRSYMYRNHNHVFLYMPISLAIFPFILSIPTCIIPLYCQSCSTCCHKLYSLHDFWKYYHIAIKVTDECVSSRIRYDITQW